MFRWGLFLLVAVAGVLGQEPAAQDPVDGRRVVPLKERAWVRFGDDPAWAAADLDLSGWTEVKLRGALRRQGFEMDGEFAWYRIELPQIRFPEIASLTVFFRGTSGATQGFINGRPVAPVPQDFNGRIGDRPLFPPPGFASTFRIRRTQWNLEGTNIFALRMQRAPRATGFDDDLAVVGLAIVMRSFQEAVHRRNDLGEGMALAGLSLGLLTALGLTLADRTDWFSRGMIPVCAILAAQVALTSHAFFRTPWANHWTMRAGWLCAAAAVLSLLWLPAQAARVRPGRFGLTWGTAAAVVGLALLLANGFQPMTWAQQMLTLLVGAAALTCGWWSRQSLAAGQRWLLPVLLGTWLLLGMWTLHRLALHLGFHALAAVARPHYYALALAGLFFITLVLRLKGARDDYRRLLRINLTAQEDERRRIARDLHDGVGQALQALKLRLQLERRQRGHGEDSTVAEPPEQPDSVDAMDGCIQELRAVATNLRPVYLGRMPLAEALRVHAEQFGRDAGVTVRFHTNLTAGLPPAAEEHLFRIQQESLNNAVRHGRPSVIEVRLEILGRNLRLTITDDGAGGSAPAPGVSSGHGLHNLRERAELLGGTLRFERGPRGAQVVVEVPHPSGSTR